MWRGYFQLDQVELVNLARTYAYATEACIAPEWNVQPISCNNLPAICEDGPGTLTDYTTPAADNAPWYNLDFPESAEVAGFYLDDMADSWDSTYTRDIEENGQGGAFGVQEDTPRTITFTGWALAKTCCALEYYLDWLETQLRYITACSSTGCGLSTLWFLKCCPADSDLGEEDDTDTLRARYRRHLNDVSLTAGIKVLDRDGNCCGQQWCATSARIQFTITCEDPIIRGEPTYCSEDPLTFSGDPECIPIKEACETCEIVTTIPIEKKFPKTRIGVVIKRNGQYCLSGGATLDPLAVFPPEDSYFAIDEVESTPSEPYLLTAYADGRWEPFENRWNPVTIDPCNATFQIAQFCGATGETVEGCVAAGDSKNSLLIDLNLAAATFTGGTYTTVGGWTVDPAHFPPRYATVGVLDECTTCDTTSQECFVSLSADMKWSSEGFTVGPQFPPPGCDKLSIRGQGPGYYTVVQNVSVVDLQAPCTTPALPPPPDAISTSCCYLQPLQYKKLCCSIDNMTGATADARWSINTGSLKMEQVSVEVYTASGNNECPCTNDEEMAAWFQCQEPCGKFYIGGVIPAGAIINYIGDEQKVTLQYGGKTIDGFDWIAGEGGAPFDWLEIPACTKACIVVRAQYVEDEDENIITPAPDATFTFGLVSRSFVGV